MASEPAIRIGDPVSCEDISAEGSGNVFINGIPLTRMTDATAGHGCFPPSDFIDGSSVVMTNYKPSVYLGHAIDEHCCDGSCHDGVAIVGSPDVFIGGDSAGDLMDNVTEGMTPGADPSDFGSTITDDGGQDKNQSEIDGILNPDNGNNEKPDVEEDDKETPPPNEDVPVDCEDIHAHEGAFPGSFPLSPNFTLSMLTTNTLVSNYKLKAQVGLSEKQIVCNLRKLCINVLEPMKAKYGNAMRINSGFRHGTGTSQHNKGEAVDVSFSNLSGTEAHYNRAKAIRDDCVYDQFIYEQNNSIWYHLSYKESGNRRMVLTKPRGNKFYSGLLKIEV